MTEKPENYGGVTLRGPLAQKTSPLTHIFFAF